MAVHISDRNYVLLAAGRGSRLTGLELDLPKPLFPFGGRPALVHVLEKVLSSHPHEVIVVTGHRGDEVTAVVQAFAGSSVKTVFNRRYAVDTNIYSAFVGVEALARPAAGYMIIETDLYLRPSGWDLLLGAGPSPASFWVTLGKYSTTLTGGAVQVDDANRVKRIVYAPAFDDAFLGWDKLVGVLNVAASETEVDRKLRRTYIDKGLDYYYMHPWIDNLHKLPCSSVSLAGHVGGSFNTAQDYLGLCAQFDGLSVTG